MNHTSRIKQAMGGDAGAFIDLMEQEKGGMYKVACCYLSCEADRADALQETILACWEKLQTLQKPEYFRTWMTRILINKCNDILRQNQRTVPLEESDRSSVSGEMVQEDKAGLLEFYELLESIDEKYRTALVLHYVEGFSIREIASLLAMNENTVSTRIRRGRSLLRVAYMEG